MMVASSLLSACLVLSLLLAAVTTAAATTEARVCTQHNRTGVSTGGDIVLPGGVAAVTAHACGRLCQTRAECCFAEFDAGPGRCFLKGQGHLVRAGLMRPNITAFACAKCVAPPPAPSPPIKPIFHVPFNVGKGGCCADVNAIAEYKGVKHLMKQSGGVKDPTSKGLGFAHYVSTDFVRWKYVSTIVTPGGADGSLSFLPGGPVILWDCTSSGACKPDTGFSNSTSGARRERGTLGSAGCKSGDAAIIGVARPADPGDAKLQHWVKDSHNPIVVGPAGTSCYAGPSNLWSSADNKTTYLEMILNTTTGLFKSTDPTLHSWELVNGNFYPKRGGGGGLFFPLPTASNSGGVAANPSALEYTHMLQSDFPGHADGTAFYALGVYDAAQGKFDLATGLDEPRSLDFSQTYVYNQLGYDERGRMVNAGWIRNLGTSIVREVKYDPTVGGGQLLSYPLAEVETLRSAVLASTHGKALTLKAGENATLVASGATAADLQVMFALDTSGAALDAVVTALGTQIQLQIEANHSTASIAIIHRLGAVDQGHSPQLGVACAGTFAIPAAVTEIELRVVMDGVSLEVFAAHGRGVCSFATAKPPSTSSAVVVAAAGGDVVISNATVWQMSAIDT